jgi:hypothetical protein
VDKHACWGIAIDTDSVVFAVTLGVAILYDVDATTVADVATSLHLIFRVVRLWYGEFMLQQSQYVFGISSSCRYCSILLCRPCG